MGTDKVGADSDMAGVDSVDGDGVHGVGDSSIGGHGGDGVHGVGVHGVGDSSVGGHGPGDGSYGGDGSGGVHSGNSGGGVGGNNTVVATGNNDGGVGLSLPLPLAGHGSAVDVGADTDKAGVDSAEGGGSHSVDGVVSVASVESSVERLGLPLAIGARHGDVGSVDAGGGLQASVGGNTSIPNAIGVERLSSSGHEEEGKELHDDVR